MAALVSSLSLHSLGRGRGGWGAPGTRRRSKNEAGGGPGGGGGRARAREPNARRAPGLDDWDGREGPRESKDNDTLTLLFLIIFSTGSIASRNRVPPPRTKRTLRRPFVASHAGTHSRSHSHETTRTLTHPVPVGTRGRVSALHRKTSRTSHGTHIEMYMHVYS
jgi:hypothetical protein